MFKFFSYTTRAALRERLFSLEVFGYDKETNCILRTVRKE